MADIETKTDDISAIGKQVTGGSETAASRQRSNHVNNGRTVHAHRDGTFVEPSDSNTGQDCRNGEPQQSPGVFQSYDTTGQSYFNVRDQKHDSDNTWVDGDGQTPSETAVKEVTQPSETDLPMVGSDIKLQPVDSKEIEFQVRRHLAETREALFKSFADAKSGCDRLTENCDEMELTVKELADQVDKMEPREVKQ